MEYRNKKMHVRVVESEFRNLLFVDKWSLLPRRQVKC